MLCTKCGKRVRELTDAAILDGISEGSVRLKSNLKREEITIVLSRL